MRFSVYDVDNEQQIDQGDFIGSATLELSTLIQKYQTAKDTFVEYELETESNQKAWLRIKLKPNIKSKKTNKKKKNRIEKIEQLQARVEQLEKENSDLRKQQK